MNEYKLCLVAIGPNGSQVLHEVLVSDYLGVKVEAQNLIDQIRVERELIKKPEHRFPPPVYPLKVRKVLKRVRIADLEKE